MKQHINLFKIKPKPQAPVLSVHKILALWGWSGAGVVVVWLCLWGVKTAEANRLSTRLAQHAEVQTQLKDLQKQLSAVQDVTALKDELKQLSLIRDAKNKEWHMIQNIGLDKVKGFSESMVHLAEHNVEGMWLRKLRFEAGGSQTALEGTALTADLVPRWVAQLGHTPSYRGKTFDYLLIELSKKNKACVDFVLQNKGTVEAGHK